MNRKNVLFSLTIIFSVAITFVFSDSGNPPSGNPPSGNPPEGQHGNQPGGQHGGGNPGGQHGGNGGGGSGGGLTVVIAYESLNSCSENFFKSQFTSEILEEFSKCNVNWKILPCSTSKVVNGHLTCWEGETECDMDRMYACATKLNEGDMKSIAKFVLCMHKGGNQLCSAQNCATQSGIKNWDAIDKCSKTPQADTDCQKYWSQINDDWQITKIPGIMTPPSYNECESGEAAQDFKGFLCKKLKEKNISCQACGGSCGGGSGGSPGGNPGGSGGNPGGSGGNPGGSGGNPGGSGGSPGGSSPGNGGH